MRVHVGNNSSSEKSDRLQQGHSRDFEDTAEHPKGSASSATERRKAPAATGSKCLKVLTSKGWGPSTHEIYQHVRRLARDVGASGEADSSAR